MHSNNARSASSTLSHIPFQPTTLQMDVREGSMKNGWKGSDLPDLNSSETELRLGLGSPGSMRKETSKEDAFYTFVQTHPPSMFQWQTHYSQDIPQAVEGENGRGNGEAKRWTGVPKFTVPAKRGFLEALGASPKPQLPSNVASSVPSTRITPVPKPVEDEVTVKPPSLSYTWNSSSISAGSVHRGTDPQAQLPSLPAKPACAVMPFSQQNPVVDDGGSSLRAPVVGWPPVRSFRKNTLTVASQTKQSSEDSEQSKITAIASTPQDATTVASSSTFYVKVNMDGVPIGRKIDLKAYDNYQGLKLALQNMFQFFINGSSATNETKQVDLLQGTEYVLTHEDKDGDWMLVGDVPWEMFVSTVKRLRIMKATQGIFQGHMQKCNG